MKHPASARILLVLVLIASLPLMGSASFTVFDPELALPEGAFAVISISSPAILLSNVQAFLENSGFQEAAQSLKKAISEMLEPLEAEGKELAQGIDFAKTFVMALYPEESNEPATVMFLPVKNSLPDYKKTAMLDSLRTNMTDPKLKLDDSYPGYIAIGLGSSPGLGYGKVPVMSFEKSARLPLSGISLWLDTKVLAKQFSGILDSLESIMDSIQGKDYNGWDYWHYNKNSYEESEYAYPEEDYEEDYDWEELESDDYNDIPDLDKSTDLHGYPFGHAELDEESQPENSGLGQYSSVIENAASELAGIKLVLTIQKDRAWFNMELNPTAGSWLSRLAYEATKGETSLPWLKYCKADSLLSWAWSMPQSWYQPLLEGLKNAVLAASWLEEEQLGIVSALGLGMGSNGAGSLKLKPSPELVQALRDKVELDDEKAVELVSKGLGLELASTLELKDRQAFRDGIADSSKILSKELSRDLPEEEGLRLRLDRSTGIISGLPYDKYSFVAEATDENVRFGTKGQLLSGLLESLVKPVYVYSGDKVYMGLGSPAEVASSAGILKKNSLDTEPSFKAMRAGMPPSARAMLYVSTKELAGLFMKLNPVKKPSYAFDIKALSGLLLWLDAEPGRLGIGFGTGAEDIKAAKTLFKD